VLSNKNNWFLVSFDHSVLSWSLKDVELGTYQCQTTSCITRASTAHHIAAKKDGDKHSWHLSQPSACCRPLPGTKNVQFSLVPLAAAGPDDEVGLGRVVWVALFFFFKIAFVSMPLFLFPTHKQCKLITTLLWLPINPYMYLGGIRTRVFFRTGMTCRPKATRFKVDWLIKYLNCQVLVYSGKTISKI
jgi:hypothetical protein